MSNFLWKGSPSSCQGPMDHFKFLRRSMTMLTKLIYLESMGFLALSMSRILSHTMMMISMRIWGQILSNNGRMMHPWQILMTVSPNPRMSKRFLSLWETNLEPKRITFRFYLARVSHSDLGCLIKWHVGPIFLTCSFSSRNKLSNKTRIKSFGLHFPIQISLLNLAIKTVKFFQNILGLGGTF